MDLDDEELEATRKLNGVAKSNIEEDIKILEKFNPGDEYTEKIKIAIENILAERKQDKARIKELEAKNRIYVLDANRVKLELYIKENYIPKQKVKESYLKMEKEYARKVYDDNYNRNEVKKEESYKRQVYEELLEDK